MIEKPKYCKAKCDFCEECPEYDCILDDWDLVKRREQYRKKKEKQKAQKEKGNGDES